MEMILLLLGIVMLVLPFIMLSKFFNDNSNRRHKRNTTSTAKKLNANDSYDYWDTASDLSGHKKLKDSEEINSSIETNATKYNSVNDYSNNNDYSSPISSFSSYSSSDSSDSGSSSSD
ncbi:hypothetical protein [Bacillus sp. FJAT-29937]|uniref:hypothetical protein n=1 Tax=Bacillus sp. FJAT-29937 TaxID=1720553 RepID=UPI0008351413|nr:hypothetical protein [Bacillus sp. FJAT-29937]